ncbi:MAG: ASKHA domain-containing protein, partial [Alphaproteobacteria bacterium]|nr:ASKHA domain-containing protein [Alphaproteobacteria bacterium]
DQCLLDAVNKQVPGLALRVDVEVLRNLSPNLRAWEWRTHVSVHSGDVVAVGPASSRTLGIAVDLGTTNISGALVDLGTGKTLAVHGMENPQTAYGGDVISYAAFVRRTSGGAAILQQTIVEALNELAQGLTREAGETPAHVAEMVVVGNTMMHHLLAGLPVAQLAASPFVPAASEALDLRARDLGLQIAPGGYVHLAPNIAGFVGGDHTAMLLATEAAGEEGVVLAMDIGTNTEISLLEGGRITSVSCPSGPALEGGHITSGMRAAVGAIEQVRITPDSVVLETIDDGAPAGICGSGVLDVVAQLYLTGVVNSRGRLQVGHPLVRTNGATREFVLATEDETAGPPVVFDQNDVRAVQLAKAAIRSATDILLAMTGHTENQLDRVIVAGAFGNYIDIASAIAVGMLPDLPFSRFAQVGNAAGDGARQMLMSMAQRARAREIAAEARYVELAGTDDFMSTYVGRINFEPVRGVRHAVPADA